VQFLESKLKPAFHSDDDSIPETGYIRRYQEVWEEAHANTDLLDIAPLLEAYLKEQGFVDVRVVVKKLPVGPWAKSPRKKVCDCPSRCILPRNTGPI
jgi:hypothetical protein